jgi:hypothetical protein
MQLFSNKMYFSQGQVARRVMPGKVMGGKDGGTGAGIGSGVGGNVGGGGGGVPSSASTTPKPAAKPVAVFGASTADAPMPSPTPPADEVRQKVHPSVFAVVERLRKKEALTAAGEGGFIRNGKAEVQVWVSEKSVEALAKLKELGFEVLLDDKNSKLIIGRLPIDKLETLVKLKFVNYVSPQK